MKIFRIMALFFVCMLVMAATVSAQTFDWDEINKVSSANKTDPWYLNEATFYDVESKYAIVLTTKDLSGEHNTGYDAVKIYDVETGRLLWQGDIPDGTAGAFLLANVHSLINDSLLPTLGAGGGNEAAAYVGASGKTTRLVFNQLVLPSAKTRSQKAAEAAQAVTKMPQTVAATVRYEKADFEESDNNGDIYGFNLGYAVDVDNMTFGVMIPYDHLDFDLFDADRVGAILYGQYSQDINEQTTMALTVNTNYMYTDLDIDNFGSEDVNTFGGGISGSFTYDGDMFVPSFGVSYQYNQDDTDVKDDDQHLIKVGTNMGFRVKENMVFNCFGVWNIDVTDYDNEPDDDDYFEVGLELNAYLSETWSLSGGYKKVISLDDFDSDQVYLGAVWKF